MKEKIEEFIEDLKGRLRNPLILSFILVWLYYHWTLVYLILTIDKTIPVEQRLAKLTKYTSEEGWCNMLFYPLLISFVSLTCYYLIANIAQFIQVWVGKRLNVEMLKKSDTGRFILKSEYEKEKKKIKQTQAMLTEQQAIIEELSQNISDNKKEYNELHQHYSKIQIEYNKVIQNIDYNLNFEKNITVPLMYFLAHYHSIKIKDLEKDSLRKDYNMINGEWSIISYDQVTSRAGSKTDIIIDDKLIRTMDGKEYAIIKDLNYYENVSYLLLQIQRKTPSEELYYYLIKINGNKFIGVTKGKFIEFVRR